MNKFGKVLFIVGYILLAILLIGFTFKALHWPGSNMAVLMSLMLFAYWFLAVAVVKAFAEKPFSGLNITKSFVGGISGMFLSVGLLFKLMHWPGATITLVLGGILLIAFIILFFLNRMKSKKELDTLDKLVMMVSAIILSTMFYMWLNF
jgi:hypothetical protein